MPPLFDISIPCIFSKIFDWRLLMWIKMSYDLPHTHTCSLKSTVYSAGISWSLLIYWEVTSSTKCWLTYYHARIMTIVNITILQQQTPLAPDNRWHGCSATAPQCGSGIPDSVLLLSVYDESSFWRNIKPNTLTPHNNWLLDCQQI